MNCPRCRTATLPSAAICGYCGFSAAYIRAHLGEHWVRIERVTDVVHCLRLEELRECEVAMDDFERCFPQAFLAVYIGTLPEGLNVSELGFWLLNQGAFNTHLIVKRNDYGIVLVIDPVARAVGVTLGYGIEAYFGEEQQNRLLGQVVSRLQEKKYGQAILDALGAVSAVLRRAGQRQSWLPQTAPEGARIEVQPLRSGHRFPGGREVDSAATTARQKVKPLAPTT